MYVSVCMCVCVCECSVQQSVREREKEANPDHDNYTHNKCKTIHLSVCNRGLPIRVYLWPMPVFRNQGSRWPICDADFFGRYVYLKLPFSFFPFIS